MRNFVEVAPKNRSTFRAVRWIPEDPTTTDDVMDLLGLANTTNIEEALTAKRGRYVPTISFYTKSKRHRVLWPSYWLVSRGNGSLEVLSNKQFLETYEIV